MIELLGTPPTPPLPKFTITSWPFDFVALSIAVNGAPTQFATDFQVTVTRFEVMKGPMLVISSTRMIRPENAGLCGIQGTPFNPIKDGGFAAICGPDGRQLTPQIELGEERILYPDIDLADLGVDPVGHYSRPDLLALHLPTPAANLNPLAKEGEKKNEEYALPAKILQLAED
ncbi:hypothetical protein E1B28_010491 [Marasmius oreades]|uniref:Uncharacterized protein n=1 Tax=Marasmius oreades TaxID=181124 RepID=A0A9P7UR67_9AGAR|nr:uncharacterized protein E1B28_010491 [Marasmius oreades]KAG7091457.1 hypothetical protein E1B28_010491 [Marasmius oreades]